MLHSTGKWFYELLKLRLNVWNEQTALHLDEKLTAYHHKVIPTIKNMLDEAS